MSEKTYIYIGDGEEKVCLDPNRLHFSEGTLTEYIETEGGWIDYFGAKLAEAERDLAMAEHKYESYYSRKFAELKPHGSDKLVESMVKGDLEVEAYHKTVIEKKTNVRKLQQHLRAWDKNHENAQSRGHFLRKEMDRLNRDVIKVDNYLERKVVTDINDLDFNTDPNV